MQSSSCHPPQSEATPKPQIHHKKKQRWCCSNQQCTGCVSTVKGMLSMTGPTTHVPSNRNSHCCKKVTHRKGDPWSQIQVTKTPPTQRTTLANNSRYMWSHWSRDVLLVLRWLWRGPCTSNAWHAASGVSPQSARGCLRACQHPSGAALHCYQGWAARASGSGAHVCPVYARGLAFRRHQVSPRASRHVPVPSTGLCALHEPNEGTQSHDNSAQAHARVYKTEGQSEARLDHNNGDQPYIYI